MKSVLQIISWWLFPRTSDSKIAYKKQRICKILILYNIFIFDLNIYIFLTLRNIRKDINN